MVYQARANQRGAFVVGEGGRHVAPVKIVQVRSLPLMLGHADKSVAAKVWVQYDRCGLMRYVSKLLLKVSAAETVYSLNVKATSGQEKAWLSSMGVAAFKTGHGTYLHHERHPRRF